MLGLSLAMPTSAKPWWPQGASFAADLITGRYMCGDIQIPAEAALQFSRTSAKLAPDTTGIYRSFAPQQPARTNRGLWLEGASTNYIGNNAMIGANTIGHIVPQDWSVVSSAGLTREILAMGTIGELSYLDMRLYGTATSSGPAQVAFEPATSIAAVVGESWTLSTFVSYIGGGAMPVNCRLRLREDNAVGANLAFRDTFITPVSSLARFSGSQTIGNTDTAFVRPVLGFGLTIGATYDFSFRIMSPCLERSATASTPIVSSGTRVTRSADALAIGLPSGIHNLSLTFETGPTVALYGASGWFSIGNDLGGAPLQSITAVRV